LHSNKDLAVSSWSSLYNHARPLELKAGEGALAFASLGVSVRTSADFV